MSDNFCKLAPPKTVSRALRVLASEISAPDNVPAMCLYEGAKLIEEQDKEIESLVSALATETAIVRQYEGDVARLNGIIIKTTDSKDAAESALRTIIDNHDKLTSADCADIARGILRD